MRQLQRGWALLPCRHLERANKPKAAQEKQLAVSANVRQGLPTAHAFSDSTQEERGASVWSYVHQGRGLLGGSQGTLLNV